MFGRVPTALNVRSRCPYRISPRFSWDEEADVWYVSETDFPGLAAEAMTRQNLMRKIGQLVPDLRTANRHLMRQDERLVMEFEH